jgi:hypothetical protein
MSSYFLRTARVKIIWIFKGTEAEDFLPLRLLTQHVAQIARWIIFLFCFSAAGEYVESIENVYSL